MRPRAHAYTRLCVCSLLLLSARPFRPVCLRRSKRLRTRRTCPKTTHGTWIRVRAPKPLRSLETSHPIARARLLASRERIKSVPTVTDMRLILTHLKCYDRCLQLLHKSTSLHTVSKVTKSHTCCNFRLRFLFSMLASIFPLF